MDELRGRKHNQPLESVEFALRDPANDPHQSLAAKENSRIVREALLALPERQRTALMLVHYSGLSNPEAGVLAAPMRAAAATGNGLERTR